MATSNSRTFGPDDDSSHEPAAPHRVLKTKAVPPGESSDTSREDILEGEILEDDEPSPGDNSGQGTEQNDWTAGRDKAWQRTGEFFDDASAQAAGKQQQREHAADEEKVRRVYDMHESGQATPSDADELTAMRAATRQAGEKYMASLKDSKLLVPGFTEPERDERFNAMHHVYMQMMMQSCLRPLSQGVSARSVVQAAGMMTSMIMLSKGFRSEVGTYAQPVKDRINERIDEKTRKVAGKKQEKAGRRNEQIDAQTRALLEKNPELKADPQFLAGREDKKTSRDEQLSKRWRRRVNDLERQDRGHRDMFTPESAALTEVALMEHAFGLMRDEDQDATQIYHSYRAMRQHLNEQMEADGLDRQEVTKQARQMIGRRMAAEPQLRVMFNGMAQGRVRQAAASGHEWNDEWEDYAGRPVDEEGIFVLRRPMSAHEHQVALATAMQKSMEVGLERVDTGDRQALDGTMLGYVMGYTAQREGQDPSAFPTEFGQRFDQARVMLAGMEVDGIDKDEQQRIYSNALLDAVDEMNKAYPRQFEHELQQSFGTDWQSGIADAVQDPRTLYGTDRNRPNPAQQEQQRRHEDAKRERREQREQQAQQGQQEYQPA